MIGRKNDTGLLIYSHTTQELQLHTGQPEPAATEPKLDRRGFLLGGSTDSTGSVWVSTLVLQGTAGFLAFKT